MSFSTHFKFSDECSIATKSTLLGIVNIFKNQGDQQHGWSHGRLRNLIVAAQLVDEPGDSSCSPCASKFLLGLLTHLFHLVAFSKVLMLDEHP